MAAVPQLDSWENAAAASKRCEVFLVVSHLSLENQLSSKDKMNFLYIMKI